VEASPKNVNPYSEEYMTGLRGEEDFLKAAMLRN